MTIGNKPEVSGRGGHLGLGCRRERETEEQIAVARSGNRLDQRHAYPAVSAPQLMCLRRERTLVDLTGEFCLNSLHA